MRNSTLIALLAFAISACGPDNGDPSLRNRAIFTGSQDALTVCAGGATTKGIDVSEWQGSINWSQVAAGGWKFAFIRISDGDGHMDPYFGSNWANAKNAGLIRGAYQFFEPGESASSQAQVVINAVGKLGNGDLPVMMDVETATPNASELNTWLAAVEAGTGKRPVIYTAAGLWNSWFPNGGFEGYGLFAANWGASCPALAASWNSWSFWQYSDNSAVSGISGNVDGDVFNGSLSDLQGYATSDQAPRGYLDAADCTSIAGWSQDQDAPDQSINVDLYFGGPAGSGAPGQRVLASNSRQDLCTAIGSCPHGFSWDTPRGLMDGAAHEIHAYGIDANGSNNAELSDSPKTVTCTQSETGVRRHVTDPASYAAWGFSSFQDVRHISDTTFSGYTQAQDWPSAPQLIQGQGDAAVYLVDGVYKRHVVSPASMAAWHFSFSAVQQRPLDLVQAMPTGPDLRERPMLIQGSGAEIDVLDDPLPPTDGSSSTSGSTSSSSTGTSGSSSSSSSTTGSSGSTSGATTGSSSSSSATSGSPAASTGSSSAPATGGCSETGGGPEWLALFAVGFLGLRKRR